jgi:hypothetical protein
MKFMLFSVMRLVFRKHITGLPFTAPGLFIEGDSFGTWLSNGSKANKPVTKEEAEMQQQLVVNVAGKYLDEYLQALGAGATENEAIESVAIANCIHHMQVIVVVHQNDARLF